MAQLIVRVLSDLSQFHTDLQNSEKQLQKFGKGVTDLGGVMSVGLTLPLVGVGVAAASASGELNKGMANVATLLPNSTDRVLDLKSSVQDLAIEVGTSTKDISGGLYELISTFGDSADTVELLRINAVAAKAGLATVEEAIGVTAAVTKGYGDTTAEAVQHTADLAFVAVNLGKTTLPELGASMGHVVPIAQALGVTQEELFASMATLTGVTGDTSEVTTQLRATYQAILKPTEEMQRAMATVADDLDAQGKLVGGPLVDRWRGLTEQYNAGAEKIAFLTNEMAIMKATGETDAKEMKGLSQALKEAQDNTEKTAKAMNEAAGALGGTIVQSVGATDAINLLNDTFEGNTLQAGKAWSSVEALTAVLALSGSQAEKYAENLNAMGDATGATDQAFQDQTQTINKNGFEMEQLQAKVEVMMQKLGDGLAPAISSVINVLMPMVDLLIGAADGFSKMDPAQQTVIVGVLALVAAIGPLLLLVGTMITTFTTVATALTAIAAIAPLVGAAFTVLLGPVGLIILAIAGITAALLILWNTNEDFRGAVTGIWDFISAAFLGALDLIKLAFEDFPAFQQKAWEAVVSLTKAYLNVYIKLINYFIDQVNKLHIDVPKVELPGGGSVGGFAIDLPDIPSIPELARGALALRPTLAMIGEGSSPEALLPLERLNGMIAQASSAGANQALAAQAGALGPAFKVELHNPSFYGTGGPREFVRQINRIGTENTRTRVAVQETSVAQLLLQVEGETSPLDFHDETKYFLNHTSALPPTPVFDRHTAPRRGADGEMLVSSTQIATELRFEVRCRGATYQEALGNLSEILTRLAKAEAYAKPARTGSPVRFIRQLGDQVEPQVYEVEFGDFFRKDEALESVNYISGELYLRCSPIPHALTFTEVCNLGMCNYDPWVIDVGGSEPVQAKVSVTPHGDAAHYDFIRVAALDSRERDVNNFLWPMYLGLNTPPTGYTVSLEGANRVGGARLHVLAKGTGQYQLLWRTGGGDVFSAGALTTLTDGAAYQDHVHEVFVNPATELPFTEAELNAGQWGFQKVGATSVRITSAYLSPCYVERDQLTEVVTNLLPNGTGASTAWTVTGAATAHEATDDPVGTPDGDTSYLVSTTDGQITYLTYPDYTAPTGLDVGVRATVQGAGGFTNGSLEEPYSGPAFGATLVNDVLPDTTGWSLVHPEYGTTLTYNATHSAIQLTPNWAVPQQGFAARIYGGLTPGVPVRFQLDLRTLSGAPPGAGCWARPSDGGDEDMALRQHTTTWTTRYVDFIPMSEAVTVYLGVEGSASAALYKNLLVREVASIAEGWAPSGTGLGHQEVEVGGWYAGQVNHRQADGEASQAVGPGDTNNYVGQSFGVIDGESYKIVAQIQARGYAPSLYQDTPPFSFEVASGASQEVVTTVNNRDFDRVELTQVADGATMTIKAYGSPGAGGYLDGVFVQHLTEESDAGLVAFRVTIDANVVDHYGTYQLWARMKVTGGPIGVTVRSGGDDGQLVASGPVTIEPSAGVRTGRLGALVIPATPTDPSAPITSFTFSVIVESVSSSSDPVTLDIDCVELWPAGNYQIARNAEGRGPAPDEVQVFDPASGTVYVANGAGNTLRTTASVEGSFLTLYPGENLVLVRVSRSEIDDQLCPEDPFDVCLRYTEAGIVAAPVAVPIPSGTGAQWWIANFLTNHFFGPATNPQYATPMDGGARNSGTAGGTLAQFQMPIGAAGTLEAMRVKLSAAPGVGNSWTFSIGSLSVTVAGTATTADVIGAQAVSAGDLQVITIVPGGSPTQIDVNVALRFTPTVADQFVYGGTVLGSSLGSPSAPPYHVPLWNGIIGNTFSGAQTSEHSSVAPLDGTIRALHVRATSAPGGGGSWVFDILKNGVASGSVTLTGANLTASGTLAISVAAGDQLYLRASKTGSPSDLSYVSFGLVFEPSTAGRFLWAGSSVNPGNPFYFLAVGKSGTTTNRSATEDANLRFPAPANLTLVALAVRRQTASTGGTKTLQLRQNGLDGSLVASIASGQVTGLATGAEAIAAGELLNLKSVGDFGTPNGNPTWALALISV